MTLSTCTATHRIIEACDKAKTAHVEVCCQLLSCTASFAVPMLNSDVFLQTRRGASRMCGIRCVWRSWSRTASHYPPWSCWARSARKRKGRTMPSFCLLQPELLIHFWPTIKANAHLHYMANVPLVNTVHYHIDSAGVPVVEKKQYPHRSSVVGLRG